MAELRKVREGLRAARGLAAFAETAAIAWLPERSWIPALRLHYALMPAFGLGARRPEPLPAAIDGWPGLPPAARAAADRRAEQLPALRSYRPRGWRPEVEVRGLERLEAALDAGRGAVLWIPVFRYSTWIFKLALSAHGLRASHLSDAGHGFGHSWVQRRWLNRVRTSQEERMLQERIVFRGSAVNAVRAAHRRLREGGLVSITLLQRPSGDTPIPFFDRTYALPEGPARLAAGAGAPLFPLMCVRARDGRFIVTVEANLLSGSPTGPGLPRTASAKMIPLLEDYCRRYPGQFALGLSSARVSRDSERG